jgi:predicted RNA binding protein YcfA (HicA-like mRNA interferase family)
VNSKDLIKQLEQAGWQEVRVKGSHHHFRHPKHSNLLTVPHPKKDLGKGLVAKILKDAGL